MGMINIDILSQPTAYPKYYVTATLTKKNSDGTHTILLSDVEFPYGFTESTSPHAYYDTIDNYFVFDQNGGYAFTFNWVWKPYSQISNIDNTLDFYRNIGIISENTGRVLAVEFVESPIDATPTGNYYHEWTTSYGVETISIPNKGSGLKFRLTLIDNDYESYLKLGSINLSINSTENTLYDWGVAFSTSSLDYSYASAPSSVGYNTIKTSMKYAFDISNYGGYPSDWYLNDLSSGCILSTVPDIIADDWSDKQRIIINLISGSEGYLADKQISQNTTGNRVGYNGQTSTLLTFEYLYGLGTYWYPSNSASGYRDAMGGTSSESLKVPDLNNLVKDAVQSLNIRCKINNNWVSAVKGYIKVSGVWQPIQQVKTKINQQWN